ncbi:hypothetical protein COJ96_26055 [Bacillus sp. AFS073361]|nr:hypothetical protein COJ96_26055 [Bacillus sp. AFS073361]
MKVHDEWVKMANIMLGKECCLSSPPGIYVKMEFMSRFFGYTPYWGWGFELTVLFVVWGLPALAFLLLAFMVFQIRVQTWENITVSVYCFDCGCFI